MCLTFSTFVSILFELPSFSRSPKLFFHVSRSILVSPGDDGTSKAKAWTKGGPSMDKSLCTESDLLGTVLLASLSFILTLYCKYCNQHQSTTPCTAANPRVNPLPPYRSVAPCVSVCTCIFAYNDAFKKHPKRSINSHPFEMSLNRHLRFMSYRFPTWCQSDMFWVTGLPWFTYIFACPAWETEASTSGIRDEKPQYQRVSWRTQAPEAHLANELFWGDFSLDHK